MSEWEGKNTYYERPKKNPSTLNVYQHSEVALKPIDEAKVIGTLIMISVIYHIGEPLRKSVKSPVGNLPCMKKFSALSIRYPMASFCSGFSSFAYLPTSCIKSLKFLIKGSWAAQSAPVMGAGWENIWMALLTRPVISSPHLLDGGKTRCG